MQIGELSSTLGISRDAIRFYEKRGLIRATRRPNGYRHFGEESVLTLRFVLMAQKLGFTLAEIGAELPAASGSEISAERLANILRDKLELIDQRIAHMKQLRSELEKMLDSVCPLTLNTRA